MIRLIICGAGGRMGQEISNMVMGSGDIEVIAGIEASGHDLLGTQLNGINITDDIKTVIEKADCIVDFTNHSATIENMKKAQAYKKPYVTGTTGFSQEELKKIDVLAKSFPIFLAPNMSVGVNHLYNMVQSSVSILGDYDIELVEAHHRAKKDAPSGTAKAIAKIIKDARPDVEFIYGREGVVGERKKNEICINSIRGGDIVGEHRVLFLGQGEFIELRHYATSRSCFAAGALEAVKFIINKAPGLYSMRDMLTKV
jgi:4-hydroxy-tetrahydrodipicolinate reductase